METANYNFFAELPDVVGCLQNIMTRQIESHVRIAQMFEKIFRSHIETLGALYKDRLYILRTGPTFQEKKQVIELTVKLGHQSHFDDFDIYNLLGRDNDINFGDTLQLIQQILDVRTQLIALNAIEIECILKREQELEREKIEFIILEARIEWERKAQGHSKQIEQIKVVQIEEHASLPKKIDARIEKIKIVLNQAREKIQESQKNELLKMESIKKDAKQFFQKITKEIDSAAVDISREVFKKHHLYNQVLLTLFKERLLQANLNPQTQQEEVELIKLVSDSAWKEYSSLSDAVFEQVRKIKEVFLRTIDLIEETATTLISQQKEIKKLFKNTNHFLLEMERRQLEFEQGELQKDKALEEIYRE